MAYKIIKRSKSAEDAMRTEHIQAPKEAGRVDLYLAGAFPELSRSRIQNMLKSGEITVDGKEAKPNLKLAGGEQIRLAIKKTVPLSVEPEEIALDILYEDKDIIVVNKPQGMVVHPAAGHYKGTLVNALLHHCNDLSGINGIMRPGIVHRIDKDTSGVLVVAKNDAAHQGLVAQWKKHSIKRLYIALLHGVLSEGAGIVDAPIGRSHKDRKKMAVDPQKGRTAITHYQVLERFTAYTLVQLRLETGRTHQIRVHMSYLGHPVAGDPVYGPKKSRLPLMGQALHAQVLGFNHPLTGRWLEYSTPPPLYFEELLEGLRRGDVF